MSQFITAYISIALLLFLCTSIAMAAVSYGRCQSQFNSIGICVQLADCQYIVNIIASPLTTEMEETLRKSQCGWDNSFTDNARRIVVCCPEKYLPKIPSYGARADSQLGNVLPFPGECGTGISEFIYGGNKTRIVDYPWMALLRYKSLDNELEFLCGGSLINARYVLTAAHCLNQSNPSEERTLHSVRLGEWDLETNPDCEVDVRDEQFCAPPYFELGIESAVPHPKYVSTSAEQYYDIAVLRLEESVLYSDFIRPICLPVTNDEAGNIFVNAVMEVAGWGATDMPRAISSTVKMNIYVRIWETDICQRTYKALNRNISVRHHLCAGGVSGIDACGGDSGGPLMLPEILNNRIVYYVTGVISFGPKPCGFDGWPGVYSRVDSYAKWIRSVLMP